jgi:hypothetical protein
LLWKLTVEMAKITETGVLYIPKELREAFSRDMKIIRKKSGGLDLNKKITKGKTRNQNKCFFP